jgi:hypothetical protein
MKAGFTKEKVKEWIEASFWSEIMPARCMPNVDAGACLRLTMDLNLQSFLG